MPARRMHVCAASLPASVPDGATAANTVIAYEPVWAIGTGKTPTAHDIAAMHAAYPRTAWSARSGRGGRGMLILYGGSVKPDNAGEILNLAGSGWRAGGRRQS